jgi:hypothetical protein
MVFLEGPAMFDQVFESLRKATESSVAMQQELFKKWIGMWPGVPASVFPFGEPHKFQKKWVELVSELLKKQNESLEVQFKAGLRNIEEAFHLAEAKDPEELRTKTIELWQKTFDCLRQASEAQLRNCQDAIAKWAELMTKGVA